MMQIAFNVALTSGLLSLVLWISTTNPKLGGFVLSLPLSTLIALAFSKLQGGDVGNTFLLAKSVFIGVPASLVFFLPFLVAEKWKIGFWGAYLTGFLLLGVSYFVHKWIMTSWTT